MKPWFSIDRIDDHTHIISEYRHWEETHCYLLEGNERALLIDTGLGICDISEEVKRLTDKPVTAVATHIHWDHVGGYKYYPDFYAHEEELNWLNGESPLSMDTIRSMVIDRCDLLDGYDVGTYEFFQGTPARVLHDGDALYGTNGTSSLYGENSTFLAWYADKESISREISKIQTAMVSRADSYELKYSVKTERHFGGIRIVR